MSEAPMIIVPTDIGQKIKEIETAEHLKKLRAQRAA